MKVTILAKMGVQAIHADEKNVDLLDSGSYRFGMIERSSI